MSVTDTDQTGSAATRLCAASEVPENSAKQVQIDGRPPLVVINLAGKIRVMDDTCTHGFAFLSEGIVDTVDGVIECPLHGGTFDIATGEPVDPPCELAMKTYAAEVRDGDVYAILV